VIILGAGTAGIGVADQIRDAMMRGGLSKEDAIRRFWFVDRQGLLTSDMKDQLRDYQVTYARPSAESKEWRRDADGNGTSPAGIGLAEVVHRVQPTMLIGASEVEGRFTEAIIRDMAAHTERPIIFVLSNPPVRAEANPSDLIAWTDGRALIATGSPFAPVTHRGVTYVIGQINNAVLYPGLALGAIVSRASRVTNGMFAAAANAVSSLVTVRQSGASLLPHIDDLRSVSVTVAAAVAEAAEAEGVARANLGDIVQQVQDAMWQAEYREIKAF
jgi:malate dehydrogenase (oxaloacetate-decarboxylating)